MILQKEELKEELMKILHEFILYATEERKELTFKEFLHWLAGN